MGKQVLILAVLVLVSVDSATASCDACKTTYTTEKVAAGADNTLKCSALKNYLTCLGSTLTTTNPTGCPPTTSDALAIESDFTAAGCASSFTDTCVCQKDFWKTDQTLNNQAVCSASKKYIGCLRGKTNPGCDGATLVTSLASTVDGKINSLGTTDCPLALTTCSCDIQYAKSPIVTDSDRCRSLQTYLSCLVGKTGTGCDDTTPLYTLAASASASLTSILTCNRTATCNCEINYSTTQITTANNCSELKRMTSCVQNSIESRCDPTLSRQTLGTLLQSAFTDLGSTCPITNVCQCQIDFARADVTVSRRCDSASALYNCVGSQAGSETSCDGASTQSSLLLSIPSDIQDKICSTATGLTQTYALLFLAATTIATLIG